jgi:CRP-like cAMP-binding protein
MRRPARDASHNHIAHPDKRTNAAGRLVQNEILLAIPEADFIRIQPCLEFLDLPRRLVLHEPNRKVRYVYFPNHGLISLVVETANGKTVEVGVVGKEGVTGMASIAALNRSPLREVVQIEGEGFRAPVQALRQALKSAPQLQKLMNRYAVLQGLQISQTAACNRLHEVTQRLARWLLMVHDRVKSPSLPLTHDFVATMLGTDRPSVTLAAGALQRKGAIENTRGAIKILSREKLESAACECYEVIRQLGRD